MVAADKTNIGIDQMVIAQQDDVPIDGSDTSSDPTEANVNISSPFDISKIRIEPKPGIMEALIKRIKHDEIDLAPDFQRLSGIWTDAVQSRLIESLILRIPIPAFYFDGTDDNKWLVVDGLQRLTAIKRFVVQNELKLSGLEFLSSEYNGMGFDNLPRNLQRNIEEANVTMYLIKEGTPADVKFTLFKRINTGGLPLSSQEIRHALNQGKMTRILQKLADSEDFKTATAYGISPKRMDDRECVQRFFAFMILGAENYDRDDFDGFLNKAMAIANKMPDKELEALCQNFTQTMQSAEKIFQNDAFRKRYNEEHGRYPVSKALFEIWSVNLAQLSEQEMKKLIGRKNALKKKFMKVMNTDRDFEAAITQGTGSIAKVRYRFKVIRELVQGVLHDSE